MTGSIKWKWFEKKKWGDSETQTESSSVLVRKVSEYINQLAPITLTWQGVVDEWEREWK